MDGLLPQLYQLYRALKRYRKYLAYWADVTIHAAFHRKSSLEKQINEKLSCLQDEHSYERAVGGQWGQNTGLPEGGKHEL